MASKAEQKLEKANKKIKELEKGLAAAESSSRKFEKKFQDLEHLTGLEEKYHILDEQCAQLMVCFWPFLLLPLTCYFLLMFARCCSCCLLFYLVRED